MKLDKIRSIEPLGERETMDIQVDGDHLYFANGILVSNSLALPMTADLFLAMMTNDELELQNMQMWKQLKNRFKDMSERKRFGIGVDKAYMRLKNLTDEEQRQFKQDFTNGGNGGKTYGADKDEDDTYMPPARKMTD